MSSPRTISLQPLTIDKIGLFKELLGSPDFGGCFCAVWTSHGEDWVSRCRDKSQPNFEITRKDLESGRHVGFFVFDGPTLVGWTGSGPKSSFPFLKTKLGSRLSEFEPGIWSIGCLAIKEAYRGSGISKPIVEAVIAKARAAGAQTLEAYPVRPFDEARIFRGTHKLYQDLGFTELGSEKDGDFDILLMSYRLRD